MIDGMEQLCARLRVRSSIHEGQGEEHGSTECHCKTRDDSKLDDQVGNSMRKTNTVESVSSTPMPGLDSGWTNVRRMGFKAN